MSVFTQDQGMLEYGVNRTYSDIFCFSTTRHGGCGTGTYASFNCTHYCGDDPEHVRLNRERLLRLLPSGETCRLIVPHQTHGDTVRRIDEAFLRLSEEEQAAALEGVDALMGHVPGTCLCVSTADCIPVLCYDPRLRVAAVIHAGWRGTVAGIVRKTVRQLQAVYGSRGEDLVACIGPGISLAAFEVGDEVYEAFRSAGFPMERIARRTGKWHLDLWEANRLQLIGEGVPAGRIETAGICTYRQSGDFFSARRLGIRSGRILTGILLKPVPLPPAHTPITHPNR